MFVSGRRHQGLLLGFVTALASALAKAQATVYYFSGAVQVISQQSGSPAAQAQCPAGYPNQCNNINPDYCCPANNVCSNNNNYVACCPSGVQCSGAIGGANGYSPLPTTTYYQPEATTVYGVVTVYQTQVTTTQATQVYQGDYCSTLTQKGPGLPTTAAGGCGIILIVPPSSASRNTLDWMKLLAMTAGLHLLGALVLMQRT